MCSMYKEHTEIVINSWERLANFTQSPIIITYKKWPSAAAQCIAVLSSSFLASESIVLQSNKCLTHSKLPLSAAMWSGVFEDLSVLLIISSYFS